MFGWLYKYEHELNKSIRPVTRGLHVRVDVRTSQQLQQQQQ